jgi:hypothetical protein
VTSGNPWKRRRAMSRSGFFDDVERELVRAAKVRIRIRRLRRASALGFVAALLLGAGATAAAGTYLALRNSSIAPFAADSTTPEQRVEPGTSRVLAIQAADPARGVPRWVLRVSRSAAGLQCSTVGQLSGGAFGLVGLDGRFRELPEANADACGDDLLGTRVFSARRTKDVRTVVYGVAGPELQRVTVAVAGAKPRTLRHTAEGGFLAVLRGYPEDAQPVVTLQRDGRTKRYAFAVGGFVVPDPLGGRAWKLNAFVSGTPKRRARQTGCITFMTARAVPGEANVSSPPVCGLEAARPGVSPDTLFFTTRRLSGDRQPGRGSFFRGDWNHHPARTAVWGSARGHRRIVVRAPGATRVVSPKLNGGFLVLFAPSVDPAAVSVEVDGQRYGSTFGTVGPPRLT